MNSHKINCLILALTSSAAVSCAAPIVLGNLTGNPAGENAIDIQSNRTSPTEAATNFYSIAIGAQNTASGALALALGANNYILASNSSAIGHGNQITTGEYSFVAGFGNSAAGDYSISIGSESHLTGIGATSVGAFNEVAEQSVSIGLFNAITGFGFSFGSGNIISGGDGVASPTISGSIPSGAYGAYNTINLGGNNSYAFGRGNTISASDTTVLGTGITNNIAGSTMIGPSNAAKVTILSSGNVGIGTVTPTSRLHVAGDINVTGNIINPGLAALNPGASSTATMRIGGTVNPTTNWQGGTTAIGSDSANKIVAGYLSGSIGKATIGAMNSNLDTWTDFNITGDNLIFSNNLIERMRLSSQGYLGIGTSTPRSNFDIVKNSGMVGARINIRTFTGTLSHSEPSIALVKSHGTESAPADMGTSPNEPVGSVSFFGRYNGFEGNVAKIYTYVDGAPSPSATQLPGVLAFSVATESNGTAYIPMVINSKGHIGMGTLTPQSRLDVNGDMQINGDIKVKNNRVIRISPAGDIPMIANPAGANPASN